MVSLVQGLSQLVVVCLFLVVGKGLWEAFVSPLRRIPGPFLAKITNLWRAAETAKYQADIKHRELHRKYGSAVRMGPNMVSLSDPSLIRTVYATKNPWVKSEAYRPNDVLLGKQRISNVFNTQDEDWHKRYIRPIRPFWTMSKVLDYEPLIDETLTKWMTKIGETFADGPSAGTTFAGDEWLSFFAWDVTANVSFGRHYGFIDQGKDVNNLIVDSTKGLYYFAPVSQIPWIDYLLDKNPLVRIGPKPTLTGVMYAFQVCGQYQAELAEKGRKAGEVEHSLDKYVSLKESYPDMVDDAQIVNWLMLSILAGGDTTSAIMRAVVYYLSKNQTAYNKLTDELDAAKLSMPAQWKDIKGLPYLDAVLRESLRINPGLAMILERVVPAAGFTLPDGRFIPGGTKVGMNPGVTCHDRGIFGDDADDFNPDRWLPKKEESEIDFQTRYRRMRDLGDFAFGAGERVCMGRYLATMEIWKLFATLFSQFDMKLANPKHIWKYRNAWFVYQSDMPCVISRRNKSTNSSQGGHIGH